MDFSEATAFRITSSVVHRALLRIATVGQTLSTDIAFDVFSAGRAFASRA